MHKAKKPKLLISVLAVFSLIFGGVAVSISPASAAASYNGCFNSNAGSNAHTSCLAQLALNLNPSVINGVSGTPEASFSSTATLSATDNSSLSTVCTAGIVYSVTDTTPLASYVSAINSSSGALTVNRSGSPTSNAVGTYTYTVKAVCSATGATYTAEKTAVFQVIISSTALTTSVESQAISGTENLALSTTITSTVTRVVSPSYTIQAAELPDGLTANSSGLVTGTPTTAGTYVTDVVITGSTQVVTVTVTFTITAASGGATGGAAAPEPSRKVTICHRTHAVTNPYVRITVDYNSVNKKSGHQIHDEIFAGEHVFKAGIYKRAKDKDWGDIIPADPSGLNRWKALNWTPLGADIYNGKVEGCPAFDAVKYYNALREAGVPEKKIKQEIGEIETEQSEAEPTTKKSNVNEIKYTGSNKNVEEADNDKVTLCHRTNSITNPYVRITVAASSVYKNAGHYGHDEIYDGHHVFDSSVTYPNNKKDWGDIIPADSTGKNRWAALNMTTLGKKIYDGTVEGCAEKSLQTLYNELREEGKSKKEIIQELEKSKNTDVDPKDLDELEYTGTDPKTEKTEPKEPVEPANVKIPDQSLSGIVWLDINKDGLKDPDEPLMKNIKLYVVQVSSIPAPVTPANMLVNASVRRAEVPTVKAAAVSQVLTDANGFYLFPSLGAGDWKVTTTVPNDLYVTYDSHESSDGDITTTVPVASHAFTWVGLVGETESVTLAKLKEILTENPTALPTSQLPPELKTLVQKAKAAIAAGKKPVLLNGELAYTGTNDLALLFFGVLLMLSGLALRLARTKR